MAKIIPVISHSAALQGEHNVRLHIVYPCVQPNSKFIVWANLAGVYCNCRS